MRVALISPYDLGRFGGVQDQCFKLAAWLSEAGHEAVVAGPGEGPSGTVSLGKVRQIPANGARTPIAIEPGLKARVEDVCGGADVVHVHEPLMPGVGLAALAADTPPKVGTFHADPPAWVRRLYRLGRPLLERRLRRLDVVTAVSPVAQGAMRRLVPAVRIIPNGIEAESYQRDVARIEGRVVFVGRDDPRKGLAVLREAWVGVRAAIPEASLTVVGAEGTDADGIRFLGRVSEDEKRDALAEASVAVAPNLGGESFGIVVLEAMAAGCAVVASGLPAFTAVGGEAVQLVPPGDAGALRTAVVGLLNDSDRSRTLGAQAAERALEFDRSRVLALYVDAYESAIAGR
ncbi:MAG: glycosyltransferase family 4 protein [Acidimicrobiia bacterium]|nr:glycosyltransferase family 4 protein [Acidimicrobiia bacterium]